MRFYNRGITVSENSPEGLMYILRIICTIILISSFCLGSGSTAFAEEMKIGFFDMQKVLLDSRAVAAYRQKLSAEIESKRRAFESKQMAVRQAEESLARDGHHLSAKDKAEREEKLAAERRELKRFSDDIEADIQRLDRELGQKMRLELGEVITTFATKEKFSIIAERNAAGIYFLSPAFDITDKIIALYDAQHK
jgi:outer membrane protein